MNTFQALRQVSNWHTGTEQTCSSFSSLGVHLMLFLCFLFIYVFMCHNKNLQFFFSSNSIGTLIVLFIQRLYNLIRLIILLHSFCRFHSIYSKYSLNWGCSKELNYRSKSLSFEWNAAKWCFSFCSCYKLHLIRLIRIIIAINNYNVQRLHLKFKPHKNIQNDWDKLKTC